MNATLKQVTADQHRLIRCPSFHHEDAVSDSPVALVTGANRGIGFEIAASSPSKASRLSCVRATLTKVSERRRV
jgi:hypothetical protein